MDINDIRGLSTVFAMTAFLGVAYWAYSGRKKKDFEEAAALPFADEFAVSDVEMQSSNGKNKKEEVSQ